MPQVLQTNSTGRGALQSSVATPIGMPHFPQNLVPGGYLKLQRGHVTTVMGCGNEGPGPGMLVSGAPWVTGWKVVLPQRPQNLAPAANRDWHRVHMTTPGTLDWPPARLSRLPPCEGVNWLLVGALLNCA